MLNFTCRKRKDKMLKLSRTRKLHRCEICKSYIPSNKKTLTLGFTWFCSIKCYNQFELDNSKFDLDRDLSIGDDEIHPRHPDDI